MTRQSRNFEHEINSTADTSNESGCTSRFANCHQISYERANFQGAENELVDRRVIPPLELKNEKTSSTSDWAAARDEARRQSESSILGGKQIHNIRYGDTLWDIASANYKRNNGKAASNAEIAGEVNRLVAKNKIADPNKIDIGTAIDTSAGTGQGRSDITAVGRTAERQTPNYYDFAGRRDQSETRRTPNYYNFQGRQQRSDTAQNYYDLNGGRGYRQPEFDRTRPEDVPLTPESTRRMLESQRQDRSFGPRQINPGMEVTPQAKNTANWRNNHSQLVAKAGRDAPNVVFYGDSITQGLQLNPNFKSAFGGSENFGIGGDTNQNLLYRLRNGEARFPGRKPDTAVLLIGTNNIGSQSVDKIAAGVLANAKELSNRLPGTEIIVMGILPRGYSANDSLRKQVNAVNEIVRKQLDGVSGVKFVDVSPQLLDERGNMRAGVFQKDNVHLTYNNGYSTMLNALQPHIRSRR